MKLLDKLKVARTLAQVAFTRKRVPLAVSYIITNRCNYSCAYCYRWRRRLRWELTTDAVLGLFDELRDLGTRFLQVSGGEPFLRPDLAEILRHAKACGFYVGLNTNGALVDRAPEALDFVDSVGLSLDGPPEIHEQVRPKGSFDAAMHAIEVAKARGAQVKLAATLTEFNTEHIEYLIRLAEEKDVQLQFQPASVQVLTGPEDNPVAADREHILGAIDRIADRAKASPNVQNWGMVLKFMRRWPYRQGLRCAGGHLFYRIDSNGDVLVCGRRARRDERPPNVLKLGVREALARVPEPVCDTCYNHTRLRLNILYSLLKGNRAAWTQMLPLGKRDDW